MQIFTAVRYRLSRKFLGRQEDEPTSAVGQWASGGGGGHAVEVAARIEKAITDDERKQWRHVLSDQGSRHRRFSR